MKLQLVRDDTPDSPHNFGKLYANGEYIGETLEDKDREGEEKVDGDTCIPRGMYQVIVSRSARFNRRMPEVLAVPNFSGIRIHGGNYAGLETFYTSVPRDILKDVLYSEEYLEVTDDEKEK